MLLARLVVSYYQICYMSQAYLHVYSCVCTCVQVQAVLWWARKLLWHVLPQWRRLLKNITIGQTSNDGVYVVLSQFVYYSQLRELLVEDLGDEELLQVYKCLHHYCNMTAFGTCVHTCRVSASVGMRSWSTRILDWITMLTLWDFYSIVVLDTWLNCCIIRLQVTRPCQRWSRLGVVLQFGCRREYNMCCCFTCMCVQH